MVLGTFAFICAVLVLVVSSLFAWRERLSWKRVSRMWITFGAFLGTWGLLSAFSSRSTYQQAALGYLIGAAILLGAALAPWVRVHSSAKG